MGIPISGCCIDMKKNSKVPPTAGPENWSGNGTGFLFYPWDLVISTAMVPSNGSRSLVRVRVLRFTKNYPFFLVRTIEKYSPAVRTDAKQVLR